MPGREEFSMTRFPFLRALALGLAITVAPHPGSAQTTLPPDGSVVVARIDGHEILIADVRDAIQALPEQYRNLPMETLFTAMVDQLIDRHLMVARARALNLGDDLEVKRTLRQLESRVLEQTYLRRIVEGRVTDEAVRRRYERDKDTLSGGKKVRARHILVKTRDEAMAILREISRGKDFATLAREKSIGPSKTQGGDLGFFTREAMLPAFSNVAFSLKKGEVSRAPVQTQYGWHVIKVEDIQEAGPPPLDDVKDELRAKMGDELVEAEIKRLRGDAKVERFGMDGKPAAAPVAPKPR
jgi:peptidyl-prolyl cis-trans isomerase C